MGPAEQERALWPQLRDRLRVPGRLMGLMRGVLGGDAEAVVVVTTTPAGTVGPVAMLMTGWIREHLYLYSRELWHRSR